MTVMDVKDFQKISSDIVRKVDDKCSVSRDAQLNLSQLLEELGELARLANLEKLRNRKPRIKDLEDEFADVFLQLAALAEIFDVDLEKAVLEKIETLRKRHGL